MKKKWIKIIVGFVVFVAACITIGGTVKTVIDDNKKDTTPAGNETAQVQTIDLATVA